MQNRTRSYPRLARATAMGQQLQIGVTDFPPKITKSAELASALPIHPQISDNHADLANMSVVILSYQATLSW